MTRVLVVVEGQTERLFVEDVLRPVLKPHNVFLGATILGKPGHKGGNTAYARVRKDIVTLLRDPTVYCSTMLDFYGLGKGFPGMPLPDNLSTQDKAHRVEQAVRDDIGDNRFLPYLQMHEFESLLFSDAHEFASGIRRVDLAKHFKNIRERFATPEDINDDANTAPSRRILAICPSYSKTIDGKRAAEAVGIERMRRACPHFNEWVGQLEKLGAV